MDQNVGLHGNAFEDSVINEFDIPSDDGSELQVQMDDFSMGPDNESPPKVPAAPPALICFSKGDPPAPDLPPIHPTSNSIKSYECTQKTLVLAQVTLSANPQREQRLKCAPST